MTPRPATLAHRRRVACWAARCITVLIALGLTTAASATELRRPFDSSIGLGYGYDHNGGAAGCTDYACQYNGKCYDGHKGSDFPLPYGTVVRAAANGTVTYVSQGCPDVGFYCSQCGGGYGNYVRVQHADGKLTYYAHLKNGSIAVSNGQSVSCGQKLGESASSGCSTGYHLHFEVRVSGVANDPYTGGCSGPVSYWVSQGPYSGTPSASCESSCACNSGATQNQACGNCGTRTRTCTGSCQWGGWSSCQGQGSCSPGATQNQACGNCGSRTRTCAASCSWGGWSSCQGQGPCSPSSVDTASCCDCGTKSRACNNQCQWDGWSECAGPDPLGACATGQPGPCAQGTVRCVTGCLGCVSDYEPVAEMCDAIDNDCSGEVDDGDPTGMGDPPPVFAARLVDFSYRRWLQPGAVGQAWGTFVNEGSSTWKRREIWLASVTATQLEASRLYDTDSWPAWDVAALLDKDVPPGERATFVWNVRALDERGEHIVEQFRLKDPDGEPMRCPIPEVELIVRVGGPPTDDGVDDQPMPENAGAGCSCRTTSSSSNQTLLLCFVVIVAAWRRRRLRER